VSGNYYYDHHQSRGGGYPAQMQPQGPNQYYSGYEDKRGKHYQGGN
jgi:hypothetical protein